MATTMGNWVGRAVGLGLVTLMSCHDPEGMSSETVPRGESVPDVMPQRIESFADAVRESPEPLRPLRWSALTHPNPCWFWRVSRFLSVSSERRRWVFEGLASDLEELLLEAPMGIGSHDQVAVAMLLSPSLERIPPLYMGDHEVQAMLCDALGARYPLVVLHGMPFWLAAGPFTSLMMAIHGEVPNLRGLISVSELEPTMAFDHRTPLTPLCALPPDPIQAMERAYHQLSNDASTSSSMPASTWRRIEEEMRFQAHASLEGLLDEEIRLAYDEAELDVPLRLEHDEVWRLVLEVAAAQPTRFDDERGEYRLAIEE